MYFWIFLIIVVIVILIIWSTLDKETHTHPKPHFDEKSNTLTIRLSGHVVEYKVVEEISPEEADVVSKGSDSTFVTHASFTNNKSSGTKTVKLLSAVVDPFALTVQMKTTLNQDETAKVATFAPLNNNRQCNICASNCSFGNPSVSVFEKCLKTCQSGLNCPN